MFTLNAKFDADLLLYFLSHFECDSHTVHMLTQQYLLPRLASTVKSSLFMHAHSSPLSDVMQPTFVILTMAGLLLDRPCISVILFLFVEHFGTELYNNYTELSLVTVLRYITIN